MVPDRKICWTRSESFPETRTIISTSSAARNVCRTTGRMLRYSASSSVYFTAIVSGSATALILSHRVTQIQTRRTVYLMKGKRPAPTKLASTNQILFRDHAALVTAAARHVFGTQRSSGFWPYLVITTEGGPACRREGPKAHSLTSQPHNGRNPVKVTGPRVVCRRWYIRSIVAGGPYRQTG